MLMFMDLPQGIKELKISGLILESPVLSGGFSFLKTCWMVGWWRVDIGNEIHKECLWFCFHGILQNALDEMKLYWNTHYIRRSRHETVGGVPDMLFHLPERSGGYDCCVEVSQAKMFEMDNMEMENLEIENLEMENEPEEENVYQEYFHYIMNEEGLRYPCNHNDAFDLFTQLINIAI